MQERRRYSAAAGDDNELDEMECRAGDIGTDLDAIDKLIERAIDDPGSDPETTLLAIEALAGRARAANAALGSFLARMAHERHLAAGGEPIRVGSMTDLLERVAA